MAASAPLLNFPEIDLNRAKNLISIAQPNYRWA